MLLGGLELLIIAVLATAVTGLAILIVAAITMAVIETFFDEYKETHEIDPDDLGVVVNNAINDGSVNVVAGVFNKRSGKLLEGAKLVKGEERKIEIDKELTKRKVTIFA